MVKTWKGNLTCEEIYVLCHVLSIRLQFHIILKYQEATTKPHLKLIYEVIPRGDCITFEMEIVI